MTVNIPLLRKAVEWAEAEAEVPEAFRAWHQRTYVSIGGRWLREEEQPESVLNCGTTYCIAGWVLHEAGWSDAAIDNAERPDHDAARLLGIPEWGGGIGERHLFAEENDIETVRLLAEELAGEPL